MEDDHSFQHNLVHQAERITTGANVHDLNSVICCYQSAWFLGEAHGWLSEDVELFKRQERRLSELVMLARQLSMAAPT